MKKTVKDYIDSIYTSLDHKYTKKITKKQIGSLLNYFLHNIIVEMINHNNVHLRDFMSFNIDTHFIKKRGISVDNIKIKDGLN